MKGRDFIASRTRAWDELDLLVARATKTGTRSLSADELETFLRLYRSTSADLARLRTEEADEAIVLRMNRLVARAHAVLYRSPPKSLSLGAFYRNRFPALFRQFWPFTAASVLLTATFFFLARAAVVTHPDVVSDLVGGADREFSTSHEPGDFANRFQAEPPPLITSFVTTNNIGVALRAFAFGITFGLGTAYVLVVNGAMLGGFAGAYSKAGFAREFWLTVLPHGALEMSAIMVAGGAGLALGWSLWSPGRRTRFDALREDGLRAVQIATGLAPAFVVAGIFEGFVTPSHSLAPSTKVALGVSAALVFWFYLFFSGQGSSRRVRSDVAP